MSNDTTTIPTRLVDLIRHDLIAEGAELIEALKPIRDALEPLAERLADYAHRCDQFEEELIAGLDTSDFDIGGADDARHVASMLTGSQRAHDVVMETEALLGRLL